MTLIAGTRLGPYEITAQIGVGGMGEVYRATDTNLKRHVAVKILPPSLAADADRLARFQREAEVLASLNHPHIAAIYGWERANGVTALVMELVEGQDLAESIARGPLPIEDALPIATQIAEALEAAHGQGIVHRDLKPANIKMRPDGTVKVLDFGLAKALDATSGLRDVNPAAQAGHAPTITTPAMTQAGMILGTAAYMSPEQARGKPADKRSDIWAFGCVLYEMLAGTRAFPGEDVTDTIAAVVRGEPDWNALPDEVPAHIRLLLRRCLEKDRSKRVADISIARFLITEPVGVAGVMPAAQATSVAPPRSLWRRAIPLGLAALLLIGITAAAMWSLRASTPAPVVRFPIALPQGLQFARRSLVLAVSPDGSQIAYVAGAGQIYLRSMTDMEARPIPGTDLDVMSPFFSPDGQSIGFYSFKDSTLKRIAVTGGLPVTICKTDVPPYGVTWGRDWIVFADQGAKGILRVSPDGGEPEVLVAVQAGEVFAAPQILNDGGDLVFTVATGLGSDRWDRAQIVGQSTGSTERRIIFQGGSEAHYVPTGHLLYMVGGTLFASAFDASAMQLRGGAIPIVQGVRRFTANAQSPGASFAFSTGGTFAYISGAASGVALQTIALASRDGTLQPLDLEPMPYFFPRISPDGNQLAVQTDDGKEAIIWIYDSKGGRPPRRLTFDGRNLFPLWSRDGSRITFQSDREGDKGLFWQRADGTAPAERLAKSDALSELRPEAWSPDGKTLTLSMYPPVDYRLFTLVADGVGALKPLLSLPARSSTLSPDGKWFAYASTEIGNRSEIFVQPFPPTGAKYQISTEGGRFPLWLPDGKQLAYHSNLNQRFVVVDVRTQPTFDSGRSVELPIDAIFFGNARNFDVMPDGKQFVVVRPAAASADYDRSATQQINVVLNWFDELKAKVPKTSRPTLAL